MSRFAVTVKPGRCAISSSPSRSRRQSRKHARPGRIELIRRMIGNARGAFEMFLLNAKNTTSYLPDGLALDENDLRVYRDGSWVTF